jgi:hypothetical protein
MLTNEAHIALCGDCGHRFIPLHKHEAALAAERARVERADVDRLASDVANRILGERDTPRCEGPSPYEIGLAREWVVRVLAALTTEASDAPHVDAADVPY